MDERELHGGAESSILNPPKDQFNGILLRSAGLSYCISPPRPDILGTAMSTVQEIKQAVRKLPLSKRLKVVKWVTEFDNAEWDKEMSRDASDGKLDFLVREGKEALKKSQLKPFPRP